MRAGDICNVAQARDKARRVLPRPIFDFIDSGASDEITLADNQEAYSELKLLPRAAAFPTGQGLEKTVLGARLSMPVALCPVGGVRLLHRDGDRAVARAASAAGIAYTMSTASGTQPEDVYASSSGPKWYQLYFQADREDAEALVDRVQRAGFGALFVTVDSMGPANLERLYRHRRVFPIKKTLRHGVHYLPQYATHPRWFAGFVLDGMPTEYSILAGVKTKSSGTRSHGPSRTGGIHPCPTWEDIDWIRKQWQRPLVVKGILTADDARRAVDHGADAIVISNHGGRQLDGVPATLRMLRVIRAAVGDELELLIDGGLRRGIDVVKALALGADAAMIGRPYLYGLAAAGGPGVARVLEIFRDDLVRALAQMGCASIEELSGSVIDDSGFREFGAHRAR